MSEQGHETTPAKAVSGRCLCGAVKFDAMLKSSDVHLCHCSMCRQWAGGGFLGVDLDGPAKFEDETSVGRYSASAWGERVFCTQCGSSMFWQTKNGAHVSASAGLLDLDEDARITLQFFVDEKPEYFEITGDSKKMTGAEVFAAFSGSL